MSKKEKRSHEVRYTNAAVEDLKGMDRQDADRIRKKVRFFSEQEDPLSFAKALTGLTDQFRWRVGGWRIIVKRDAKTNQLIILWILAVEKREKVYE